MLDLIVVEQVLDHAGEESNVRSLTDGAVEISDRRRPRETRIDHDELGIVVRLGFDNPFEAARMRFGRIPAHDNYQVGGLEVHPGIGHRTTAERRSQTGYRRAVSDTRLIVYDKHAHVAGPLIGQVARLVGAGRGRQHAGGDPAVHRIAAGILLNEVLVAIVFQKPRDPV